MSRTILMLMLCVWSFALASCNPSDRNEAQKLRDELEAAKAENARLKADLEAVKVRGEQAGSEEEFTDGGDFSRLTTGGKQVFSYKKVFARPPELVVETPKSPGRGFNFHYEVTERRLDGFTVEFKAATYDSKEELATYLKNVKWRATGMVPRTAR